MTLNNVHHVRTVVQQFPEQLQLEDYYRWLTERKAGEEQGTVVGGGAGRAESFGDSAKATVDRLLRSADEDFDNTIRQIVDDISQKVGASRGRR